MTQQDLPIALPVTVSRPLFLDLLALVEAKMGNNDGSHDVQHVLRVTKLALHIAQAEAALGRPSDLQMVAVVAMLHDVTDTKYCDDPTEANASIVTLLQSHGLTLSACRTVLETIEGISFRKEQARIAAAKAAGRPIPEPSPELCAVQDADRLDAIGAIGIARCFTFGGTRARALYAADEAGKQAIEARMARTGEAGVESVPHFYDKLLKLKDLLKTETARKMAVRRQAIMEQFLDAFWDEVDLKHD
ncbi:hypothetical protein BCR44DRAFT_1461943 [Catenaria anguillulae PL171]|uniref:HD/PDEase domain-containing protein n=1 Tax=Catenaria anguillulae PL171 TaxID=765915 RepID=A0A1Y2HHV8_9FUNG|nr:hypothetical protein BCR44DRAFT_1461943 [Catenaria anguillulae PL171]